ncbi:MAG: glycosyltransferase family 39 protein [Candidatus Eremiobacteraeota bacterium]|nr:glycosyltransferase family 39 protein [Candidatus Eremiobacteraeota bacterium]
MPDNNKKNNNNNDETTGASESLDNSNGNSQPDNTGKNVDNTQEKEADKKPDEKTGDEIKSDSQKTKDVVNKTGETGQKSPPDEKDKKKFKWGVWLPIVILGTGLIFRFALALSASGGEYDILKYWTIQAYSANSPDLGFSHIYTLFRNNSCSPLYSLISYVIFVIFRFTQSIVFNITKLLSLGTVSKEAWLIIFNIYLKLPVILADLGIAIIIYHFVRKKLDDIKIATIAASLYFWLPPLLFAGFRRAMDVSVIPLTVFFILLSIIFMEKKSYYSYILSGLFLGLALLNNLNPLFAICIFAWIIIKNIADRKYIKGAIVGISLIVTFLLISAPFHLFTFRPPDVPTPGPSSKLPISHMRRMSLKSSYSIQMYDVIYWKTFLESLKEQKSPRVARIWEYLDPKSREAVESIDLSKPPEKESLKKVLQGINGVIARRDFYDPDIFDKMEVSPEAYSLVQMGMDKLSDKQVMRFNRLLFETMFPMVITRSYPPMPDKLQRFYPFSLIYHNINKDTEFSSNSAFNVWALMGLKKPDNAVFVKIGRLKLTRFQIGLWITGLALIMVFVFFALRKKRNINDSLLLFALVFLIFFMLQTRKYDYMLIAVFPFLTMLFFTDYRARLLFYGLSVTCWANLYFYDHFDLSASAFTTVPGIMKLLVLVNVVLFVGAIAYFYKTSEEEDWTKSGESLKERLFTKLPTLKICQDWLAVPENQRLVALLFIAFVFRMWRLGIPETTNFDEKYYTPIARDYFYGITDPVYEASHPPLSTYIIGLGIGFLGDNVYGWRITGVLFSLLMIIVLYYFARNLFKSHIPAFFAAFLLSFDFLHFVHSRLGMLDMYASFFNLCSYYLFFLYMDRGKDKYLWGLGATIALGAACKWTTAFTIAGIATMFIAGKIGGWIWKDKFKFGQNLRKVNPLKVIAVLVVIPIIIQFFSFLPLLGTPKAVFEKIHGLTKYHEGLIGEDEIASRWWSWIFIIKPIQYTRITIGSPKIIEKGGFKIIKLKEQDPTEQAAVTGMGNPLVWWLAIPSFILCLILAYRKQEYGAMFAAMPFVFQFLPWAFVKRITYLFYMIDIIPYICLILAYCLYALYKTGKKGRVVVYTYLGLVFISFAIFYPLLTAWSVSPSFYKMYKIFSFWKFG